MAGPILASELGVLLAFARGSFRQQAAYRVANLAGLFTNSAFLVFRASVMAACYVGQDDIAGMSLGDATTYAVVTQATLMVAAQWGTLGVANDVRSGQIAVELLRPVDLYAVAMARRAGTASYHAIFRMLPLLLLGWALGLLEVPGGLALVAFLVSLGLGAIVANTLLFLYELSAFWLESDRGVRQLGGGMTLLASGLLLPVAWYPHGLAAVFRATPWAGTLDAPARIWLGLPPEEVGWTLLFQLGWGVALVVLAKLVLARATRQLQVAGG